MGFFRTRRSEGTAASLSILVRGVLRDDAASQPEPTEGRPIVLLHGFGATARMLLPLERRLRNSLGRPVVRLQLDRGWRDLRREAARVQAQIEHIAAAPGFEFADVVAHSMGGLVAAYLLKKLDCGRRIRRVITLGTPHRGTPAAIAGVMLLGAVSRPVWQMLPRSPFLRELAELPVPEGSKLVAVAAEGDSIVPSRFASVPSRRRHANARVREQGHFQLLEALPSVALVCRLLSS